MQLRHCPSGSISVASATQRRPGWRVPIQIQACSEGVHFIGPLPIADCRGSVNCCQYGAHSNTATAQVMHERMLFNQPRSIAYCVVMAFDEHLHVGRCHDTTSRKWPRAVPDQMGDGAHLRIVPQYVSDFLCRQSRPVRNQRVAMHTMAKRQGRGGATHDETLEIVLHRQACQSWCTK